MRKPVLLTYLLLSVVASIHGQSPAVLKIRDYRSAHEREIFQEYISFLSVPNVAVDTPNLQKNALMIMDMMKKRGIQQVQLLSPTTPGAAAAVYGEVMMPGATRTLIFYAHYDGQPVNASQWAPGLKPFEPYLVDGVIGAGGKGIDISSITLPINPQWRIYARGASDDKAGVAA